MFSQSQSSILIIHDIMLNVIQQLLSVSWIDRNLNFYYCLLLQVRSRALQLLRSLTQREINICEKLNLTLNYNLNHLILPFKVYLTRRASALKKAKYLCQSSRLSNTRPDNRDRILLGRWLCKQSRSYTGLWRYKKELESSHAILKNNG